MVCPPIVYGRKMDSPARHATFAFEKMHPMNLSPCFVFGRPAQPAMGCSPATDSIYFSAVGLGRVVLLRLAGAAVADRQAAGVNETTNEAKAKVESQNPKIKQPPNNRTKNPKLQTPNKRTHRPTKRRQK